MIALLIGEYLVLMTNVSSQFQVLNESLICVKSNPEAVIYLLRTFSLFAVSYDGNHFRFLISNFFLSCISYPHFFFSADVGSIDPSKVGHLVLESMKSNPTNLQIQQQGCHVIATWAFRLRRGVQGGDSSAALQATLPYTAIILVAMNSNPNDECIWGEGLFAISALLHRGTDYYLLLICLFVCYSF